MLSVKVANDSVNKELDRSLCFLLSPAQPTASYRLLYLELDFSSTCTTFVVSTAFFL
jgi:hypothetical protein